jgi:hypothetical protein
VDVDLDVLQRWMGKNCSSCAHVGDPLWIEVECEVARRIVWAGEPYPDEDAEAILARVRMGPCVLFVEADNA